MKEQDIIKLIKVLQACLDGKWFEAMNLTKENYRGWKGGNKGCELCTTDIDSGSRPCDWGMNSHKCLLNDDINDTCCKEFKAYQNASNSNDFPAFERAVLDMRQRLQAEIDKLQAEMSVMFTGWGKWGAVNKNSCTRTTCKHHQFFCGIYDGNPSGCGNFTPKSKFRIGQVVKSCANTSTITRITKIYLTGNLDMIGRYRITYTNRDAIDWLPATPTETARFHDDEARAKKEKECPFKVKQWLKGKCTGKIYCIKSIEKDGTLRFVGDNDFRRDPDGYVPATPEEVKKHFTWADKDGNEWLVKRNKDGSITAYRNSDSGRIWSVDYSPTVYALVTTLLDEVKHPIMPYSGDLQ